MSVKVGHLVEVAVMVSAGATGIRGARPPWQVLVDDLLKILGIHLALGDWLWLLLRRTLILAILAVSDIDGNVEFRGVRGLAVDARCRLLV